MTPARVISWYRSLPSRVRSPTPAKTDTPPCSLAMLLISSMMTTVFPTPAPPNAPVAEVLLHLERHRRRVVLDRILDRQRAVDRGQCFGELDVHHRPDDLNDLSRVHASASRLTLPGRRRFPAALG